MPIIGIQQTHAHDGHSRGPRSWPLGVFSVSNHTIPTFFVDQPVTLADANNNDTQCPIIDRTLRLENVLTYLSHKTGIFSLVCRLAWCQPKKHTHPGRYANIRYSLACRETYSLRDAIPRNMALFPGTLIF